MLFEEITFLLLNQNLCKIENRQAIKTMVFLTQESLTNSPRGSESVFTGVRNAVFLHFLHQHLVALLIRRAAREFVQVVYEFSLEFKEV